MTDTPSAEPPKDSPPSAEPSNDGPEPRDGGEPQQTAVGDAASITASGKAAEPKPETGQQVAASAAPPADGPPPADALPTGAGWPVAAPAGAAAAVPAAAVQPGPAGAATAAQAAAVQSGPVPGGPGPGRPGPGGPVPVPGGPVPGPYGPGAYPPYQAWGQPRKPAPSRLRPAEPARPTAATLGAILATALFAALFLGAGAGVNLLLVAVPATFAGALAARAAGRRLRPWTLVWAIGGAALLVVPALSDAGWPTFLAIVAALGLTGFALHGGRSWPSMLFGPIGLFDSVGTGMLWTWRGVRERASGSQGRWVPVLRTVLIALGLLVVFGALFAGADAAFADLLGSLMPDISVEQAPWRVLCFLLGLFGALAVARTGAAPLRWDRMTFSPGRARGRFEWALPLIVLNLLFAAFIAIQLAVLFGGYDKVLSETGLTYAEYARQGFWQLLWATLLTLAVIGLALRWAPRESAGDRRLVRGVLGTLCVLTLVVVASALRRMDLYVDAYGLTRLRISVAAMEIWLGAAILLIIAAGIWGARMLPRALAVSAAGFVLAFGVIRPDAVIAEQNVQRYERLDKIDVRYLRGLSADAVPALDRLPEPLRSCALRDIADQLEDAREKSWYETSLSEARARGILAERGVSGRAACGGATRDEQYDPDADPYAP
ncbi:DUF4153 domain-containing protein [Streptomyces sp. NPDC048018]|uniref:DUF4153 domain-containing protein n=1 Tax=Streptomyces sp. NPDC048018 TaxID=3365499 RepID=UPI00371539CD